MTYKFKNLLPHKNLVIFEPGAGGHFLADLIVKTIYGISIESIVTDYNEFLHASHYEKLCSPEHPKHFFDYVVEKTASIEKDIELDRIVPTVNRYRKVLDYYSKSTNIIIVDNFNIAYYTNILCKLKRTDQKNWSDLKVFTGHNDMISGNNFFDRNNQPYDKQYNKRKNHYKFMIKQLKSKNANFIILDYQKLIIDNDFEEIKKIVEFVLERNDIDKEILNNIIVDTQEKIRQYHDSNLKLISKYKSQIL